MIFNFKESKIHYSIHGNGKAVVLLHGFLENSSMWAPFLSVLSKNHTVITIDLPGHGESEAKGYIHTMEFMAEVVQAVLAFEKIEKASFLGHSMGGYVSLAFAEKYPEKCSKLILLNASSSADSSERKENRSRAIALVKRDKNVFISMAISNLFADKSKQKFESEIEALKTDACQMKTQGIIATIEGMKVRKDRTQILKTLKIPKTIIAGAFDPIIPAQDLKKLAANCECQYIVWEGGHMSTIENKDDLLKFLHLIEKI